MAAMKFLALRNPNERWLIDLILLFIPSTAPLDSRSWVHGKIPSRWLRSMRTNFLNGSNRDRVADLIHFSRRSLARAGCLYSQKKQNIFFALMVSLSMVVLDECRYRSPQGRLAEQNQSRQAFLFYRSHPSLRECVQIRT